MERSLQLKEEGNEKFKGQLFEQVSAAVVGIEVICGWFEGY